MKSLFLILATTLLGLSSFASGDHGEGSGGDVSNRIGPGKAVEAFEKDDGFKLSEKAVQTLGVNFQKLDAARPWRVPKDALVRIKQSTGVYRRFEGWISLVLIKVIKEDSESLWIESQDLEPGDEVAVKGAPYLRMTDTDLNAGTVDSCSH